MAIAISTSSARRDSATWRRFTAACVGALLATLIGCAIYAVETLVLRCRHRFAESPTETITRAVGIAHFLIGWLFLLSSPRIRNRIALARVAMLALLGFGLCWVFASVGGDKNPLAVLAFFAYFFAHEASDEATLYRRSGDAGQLTINQTRFLIQLSWIVALTWITLLAGFYLARAKFLSRADSIANTEMAFAWLVAAAFSVVGLVHCAVLGQRAYGSLAASIDANLPLLRVYAGLTIVLLIGSIFGSVGLNLIILVHVMTWLVGTTDDLRQNEQTATNVWTWMRQTPAGFLTLHLGLAGCVLVLMALRTHVWERTGIVCDVVSKGWFPYWSILHITIAFWRSK